MADEQLRLRVSVVDQFSRPLTDVKNKLWHVAFWAITMHGATSLA